MKKFLSVTSMLLVLLMLLGTFAACNGGSSNNGNDESSEDTTQKNEESATTESGDGGEGSEGPENPGGSTGLIEGDDAEQIENANKVMRVYRSLEKELARTPTVEDIAPYVDLSTEELTRIFNRCIEVPLEEAANMAQGENNSYMDELKAQLPNLLDMITPRERKVLELRFGLTDGTCHSLEEVAAMIGVTRERVRYIESKALRRLQRTQHHTKKPQDF